jgi:hypothetical protein
MLLNYEQGNYLYLTLDGALIHHIAEQHRRTRTQISGKTTHTLKLKTIVFK